MADIEARNAFSNKNYLLAIQIYEQKLKEINKNNIPLSLELYFGYADSLAKSGRLWESLNVYVQCSRIIGKIPLEKLKYTTLTFLDTIISRYSSDATGTPKERPVDDLACSFCLGLLINPVTVQCGHTFCKKCVASRKECTVCNTALGIVGGIPNVRVGNTIRYEPNVMIKTLVEKLWPKELKAANLREQGNALFDKGCIDAALMKYNSALELDPDSHLTLSNRSNALYRLNRCQAALEDADRAVSLQPHWGKGHYRRAVAQAGLGQYEEALLSFALCVALDKYAVSAVKLDVAKVLQKLLATHRKSSIVHQYYHPYYEHLETYTTEEDQFKHILSDKMSPSSEARKIPVLLTRILAEVDRLKNLEFNPPSLKIDLSKADSSDFDCTLCRSTIWKPVTTPCGHSYCWVCLDRCLDYSSSCPLCKTSLADYLTVSQKQMTKFLDRSLRTCLPSLYTCRLLKATVQSADHTLPIFVCTTAFPTVPCILYVFEPRYRLLVRRCVESGTRQFGIAAFDPENKFSEFGTILEIKDWVLKSDGCSILSTVGLQRFRVQSRNERDGYDTAQVEFINDVPIPNHKINELTFLHNTVRRRSEAWFSKMNPGLQNEICRFYGSMPAAEADWHLQTDGPAWVWWLLAILPLGHHLQIGILATTCIEKRLKAINKTFELIEQSERQQDNFVTAGQQTS
uniref:LON peptidase N-terminal domain and RING finger protein 3 n=1 Tax=Cacopsylla melanoneura TaxID=428564 RepID=A0A8D8W0Z4_9HEMI